MSEITNVNFEIDKTVGQLVAEDYRRAEVFRKYGIDFCCGGGRSLTEVCKEKNIDLDQLINDLKAVEKAPSDGKNLSFDEWELDFLADYIVNVHHRYVKENVPLLKEFTAKVARVHGEAHPEVIEIARLFEAIATELEQHMMKEEHILFPYIKELATVKNTPGQPLTPPPFGTVRNPVGMMIAEHDHAGELLKQIRQLSKDFTLPEDACNTYRVSYQKLEEFEADLHQHIHLENNILFPKAIKYEQDLLG